MLFNSLEFLLFFSIVLIGYYVLSHRWQNIWLLIASYIFYSAWDYRFLSLIFLSTCIDYFCGLKIHSAQSQQKRKLFLILSLSMNLIILGFFKYFGFFVESFIYLCGNLGFSVSQPVVHIILPVGISFYTFQTMSYTIDIYTRKAHPTSRFFDFALYVSFFPQLVAGPIERATTLLPQILKPRTRSWGMFKQGIFLIYYGLFEKIFVADNLAKIVEPVFARPEGSSAVEILVALYAFAFQILCDFDGYTNIARGAAKCMGFELMVNFRQPYFAIDPRDFWRRWHISLSTWIRDYLYIPLGGRIGSKLKSIRNLFVTMFLAGLWHGANWTFILWGIYHGILLILYRLFKSDENHPGFFIKAGKSIVFFHLVCFGWLFFRAESLTQIGSLLQSLTNFSTIQLPIEEMMKMILFICPLFLIQIGQEYTRDVMFLFKRHWIIQTVCYALMFYLIVGWGVMSREEFIYFQF